MQIQYKISLVFIFGFSFIRSASAQKVGIDFKNISFQEALLMSAQTGKPVFIDCYTAWCAPCKQMEKTVFVTDSVFSFYNKHFINFKIDMEKGEGVGLRKKYDVESFPTYLFVDSNGHLIHRTASLMPAGAFLIEARKALAPAESYSRIKDKYEKGDRSSDILLKYAIILKKINREEAQKVATELTEKITDEELHSRFGWQVIDNLSMYQTDRLGKYLLQHTAFFKELAGGEAVQTVLNRLNLSMMYRLTREKDSTGFFKELNEMKKDPDRQTQRNVAMLETDYYLEVNNADSFIIAAVRAANGIIENNDADLSFIARRAQYKANGNQKILKQALILARKAVLLNPEEYSNQGTLAGICLELKLKQEGLKAAGKARMLANESTSKIQKIAQELLEKIERLE